MAGHRRMVYATALLSSIVVLLGYLQIIPSLLRVDMGVEGMHLALRGGAFTQRELMTPQLIAEIENKEVDPLSPMQVHALWIGDVTKTPAAIYQYEKNGFNFTIHTNAEEILDGFHPYVLEGYKLAIPAVVGYDFLKLALLYKYGGLAVDADTVPTVNASEIEYPGECDVVFGKENHIQFDGKPTYRIEGGNTYKYSRPYQLLNWAMSTAKPRNKHIKYLLEASLMHFFGLRDMELRVIQDIAGSGLMTDYFALLCAEHNLNYPDVYHNNSIIPVDGICILDKVYWGEWIRHCSLGSWKIPSVPQEGDPPRHWQCSAK